MNNDERMLGLDPEKFKKDSWNPVDYIKSPGIMAKAMQQAVEDMKEQAALKQEQEALLGKSEEKPVNRSLERRKMLMKQMGIENEEDYLLNGRDR